MKSQPVWKERIRWDFNLRLTELDKENFKKYCKSINKTPTRLIVEIIKKLGKEKRLILSS